MKNALILLSLFATPAFANSTSCSDAAARVQYKHEGYDRGIPPRDGDVIDTIEVIVDGKAVSKSVAYKNAPPELGPISPDFSGIQVLHEDGQGRDFSAKLVLSKNEKNPAAVSVDLPVESYVICHEITVAIP